MADFDPNSIDGNDTVIKGATDGTFIGNVGDRLKTTSEISNSVVVTAETEAATFCAYALGIAIGNNKSMMSIVNASGSTVKIRIREIRIINVQNTPVTGVISDYRLLRCTGHSSGTNITPLAHDTSDTLNGSVTVKTNGTISGEAANPLRRWQFSTDEWGVGASDVESNSHDIQMNKSLFDTAPKTKTITLNANEGITIKQVTNSTVGTFDILVVFTQE